MKVLITGATGLVGKAITKVLHQHDIPVNYLTTRQEKIVSSDRYQGFLWNPSKGEIDLACFDGVTSIINLAGATIAKKWTPSYKEKVLSSRIDSLSTLSKGLDNIDSSRIEHFVSASAIGIYPSSQIDLCDEKDVGVDDSFLGQVVQKWEEKINEFKKYSFNVSILRIGIVLSNEGGALPKMAKPIKNLAGAVMGSGEQWQSWIHIDDLAEMFVFAITNNLKGVFNAVAPNPVTNEKMTKELAKVLKRPLLLPNVPRFAMKLLLGEMSYLLFASQRVCSKRIEKQGFVFTYSNIGSALEHLLGSSNPRPDDSLVPLDKEYA
ncbi:TIGR01777 family oxidoreductase [Flagellimonas sp.]|uniref:TIGR01777 family oxidoreductase n=1 Tax=Flagellimonas sp. TaxID=2058762 RepID=UPI003F49DFE4